MSRTNRVKEILAEVLKGRENDLDVADKGEGNVQVYFLMAYWNEPIQTELVNRLNKEGIALETWNVAGTHHGKVYVRLALMDPELYFQEREAEALENGVDVNVVSITDEWPQLVTTDEGYSWWGRNHELKLGPHRITQAFYDLIKKCHEESQEKKKGAHYQFEDHTYPTQAEAHRVLSNVSKVRICRPGDHKWSEGPGPEVCGKCGLVRVRG